MNHGTTRIVYMGTPEFAVAPLRALADAGMKIVGVVTAPDKPAGRGKKLRSPAVKEYAEKALDCPVLQPGKLKEPGFAESLISLEADIFVVVAFRMLPEVVWGIPPHGTINLHASLLPHYRGAAPINRVIMNGERETGVTTFLIDREIDTGRILMREEVDIGADETAGSLHDRLMVKGADLVVRTVRGIMDGSLEAMDQSAFHQPGDTLEKAPKIFREDCRIDWSKDTAVIHNLVRGLSPFPGAFTYLQRDDGEDLQVKIFETKPAEGHPGGEPGHIQHTPGHRMTVNTGDGMIEILSLQAAGKRRMTAAEFLRGVQGNPEKMSFV